MNDILIPEAEIQFFDEVRQDLAGNIVDFLRFASVEDLQDLIDSTVDGSN